ncbi:MAG: large conductance mechanosensitive channel protein MscL [Clostridia bacterium]|nr:large conductance mechanosensitive channel protein MscL [Clostridia bacterium]MBR6650969.1 large conductance mechanosensitive channel protein MscL [Clostridia bacterium]
MKKFFSDFKAFAMKGNIIDMAVGVVVGGAFSKIVTSLVNDIISPLISFATGKVMLTDLKWVISAAQFDSAGVEIKPESALMYGNFIQTIIDFLIIAFSIFLVLRVIMNAQKKLDELAKKKEEEVAAVEEAPSEPVEDELAVLKEIRELLKKD